MQDHKVRANMFIHRWLRGRRTVIAEQAGATTSEYSLLVGFIATLIAAIVGLIGQQLIPGFQAALAGL
ncbi:hypothetical protein [Arthrobacter sp. UYCo732]|uniref:Flp family type IVb pilin n=1 Tax=Arthrobacter sp. UYCo732 TaxID=3156336 RepID=UPI00339A8DBE